MFSLRVVLDTSVILMPITRPGSGHAWIREAWQNRTLLPHNTDAGWSPGSLLGVPAGVGETASQIT